MAPKRYSFILIFTFFLGMFACSAFAVDKVVVIPLNGKTEAVGDATPGDVLEGKIFSSDTGVGLIGTYTVPVVEFPAPVPKTGQNPTVPQDVTGIDGSDGKLEKGVAWPDPRFSDNSDGTVTDNLTGLIWLKNANCADITMNWLDALAFAHALHDGWTGDGSGGDCGLSDTEDSLAGDWRLPNKYEIESLVALQYNYPALSNASGSAQWTEGNAFSNVRVGLAYYWTSSTYTGNTANAWATSVSYGDSIFRTGKTTDFYVWPVRN